jgi:tRNA U34 5-carboxymethylaminomethyl modifying GTPase MnmE/TrmE
MFFIKSILKKNKLIKIENLHHRSNATSIFAMTSGFTQRCGVAVVRLSGPATMKVIQKLVKNEHHKSLEPRKMHLKDMHHPKTSEKIDRGMLVWFKGPNSFTGEDVCEFHVHGGPAVVSSLFSALSSFEECRHAEPGEFARRSFLNNKMDLIEVEGLADLINAETEMQKRQALSQMEGKVSKVYEKWRQSVIKCLANVEAYIDFSEEENVEDNVLDEGKNLLKKTVFLI